MLEGKTFFPDTGTPMRKIACMISPLALADPVPLAVAMIGYQHEIPTVLAPSIRK